MNNYKEIRLTHFRGTSRVSARFTDGDGNVRRQTNLSLESVERLQNAVIEAIDRNEFVLRLPRGFCDVGWVADRR